MSARGRIGSFKRVISAGEFLKDKPRAAKVLSCSLNLVLGFAMASARVMGGCGPFGVGLVAQAGTGPAGLMCLIGASLGYIVTGGFDWGLRYVAAAVLVFTMAFVFQDIKVSGKAWFMPMFAALVMGITGLLNSFDSASSLPAAVQMLTEAVLAGGASYFFSIALSTQRRETEAAEIRHGVSIVVFLSCILMALAEVSLVGVISVGRMAAVVLVMCVSYKAGPLAGCAAGAAFGLAMDVSYGATVFYTTAYTVSGLLCGVFAKKGKLPFALFYVLVNAVAVLWSWSGDMRITAMYETFAASVIFMVLPAGILNKLGGILQQVRSGAGEVELRRKAARRAERMSEAFEEIHDTVQRALERTTNDNEIATVFDRAADSVCASCKKKGECWHLNYMDTYSTMNDATQPMMKRGRLLKDDLHPRFSDNCERLYQFIGAVNTELRTLMFRRQFKSRLEEMSTAAYCQYGDMAEILRDMSKDLYIAAGADPLAERRLIRYLQGIDVDCSAAVFRDQNGRLNAVIESGKLGTVFKDESYLDKLSAVLGTRLCRPNADENPDDGKLVLLEAEPLAVSVGIAAMKKKGEPVSGDRGTYFKTDKGVLCVILSDGMGSGDDAAKESAAAVRVLEKFLRSGVEPATAMKILNSVMLLKNGDDWGYATVDLMCIDLFTGEASFYKYGAAPSYVRMGKVIRRVRGQSMAAGMGVGEGSLPDMVRMHLRPGSMALIASDGVLVEEDDIWLRELLGAYEGFDTKTLAKQALQTAAKQFGCEDDMTVLAVHVDERL